MGEADTSGKEQEIITDLDVTFDDAKKQFDEIAKSGSDHHDTAQKVITKIKEMIAAKRA